MVFDVIFMQQSYKANNAERPNVHSETKYDYHHNNCNSATLNYDYDYHFRQTTPNLFIYSL